MIQHLGTSVRVTIVSIVLLGIVYPLAMTGIAQALFPRQANGSLVTVNGKVVGSAIIGQLWTEPKYFHGRPSAAGKGYDPTQTGGTNFGPTSKKLIASTKATIAQLEKENPDASGPPPIDLVTSSASGIDPDISPEAAVLGGPARCKGARHAARERSSARRATCRGTNVRFPRRTARKRSRAESGARRTAVS